MRKYWPYALYAEPYPHSRDDADTRITDRELMRKLLRVVVAVVIIVVVVMIYRHLRGWPVVQK